MSTEQYFPIVRELYLSHFIADASDARTVAHTVSLIMSKKLTKQTMQYRIYDALAKLHDPEEFGPHAMEFNSFAADCASRAITIPVDQEPTKMVYTVILYVDYRKECTCKVLRIYDQLDSARAFAERYTTPVDDSNDEEYADHVLEHKKEICETEYVDAPVDAPEGCVYNKRVYGNTDDLEFSGDMIAIIPTPYMGT